MKVEVDTSEITALEQQVEQMSVWITVLVSRRKNKKAVITPDMLQAVAGSSVNFAQDESGITLTYQPT